MSFMKFRRSLNRYGAPFGAALVLAASGQSHAQSKTYDVTIRTSDIGGAGTDADVFLTVFGTQTPDGVKAPTDLDGSGNVFESGDTDTFKVTFNVPIGELEKITLSHDDSGPGSGWHVRDVKIKDPNNGETVTFEFNRWLATDEDDRLLETTKQRKDFTAWAARYVKAVHKPVGTWERACSNSQTCSARISESLTFGSSDKKSWSNTAKVSVGLKYKEGFDLEGITGSTEVSIEASDAYTKAGEIVTSRSNGHSESCEITDSSTSARIQTVWQWTVKTQVEGQPVTVKTCRTTCTATDQRPEYLPGDPRDHDTCNTPRDFEMILNAGIPGHNRETLEPVSLTDCLQSCRAQSWCKTVDYERGPGRCFIQDVSQEQAALKRDYDGNPFDHFYLPARISQ